MKFLCLERQILDSLQISGLTI